MSFPSVRSTLNVPVASRLREVFPCFAQHITSGTVVLFTDYRNGVIVFAQLESQETIGKVWKQTVSVYQCLQAWEILPHGTKIQLEIV